MKFLKKNKPEKKIKPPEEIDRPVALVVDDDEEFTRFLKVILEKLGLKMVATKTVEDFISKIKNINPSICLIDLNLNGLTAGFALVQSIRSKFGYHLPLFVVSGKSDQTAIAHAIERGATDYIVKPIDKEVLGTKISRYIESPEILEKEFDFIRAPISGVPADTQIEMQIESIDEIGIKLKSRHLISKGTIVYLQGKIIEEIFETKGRQIFTVISTWVHSDNKTCGAYAEFNVDDATVGSKVREWIVKQKK